MANEVAPGNVDFDPEINIVELGKKIRKLDSYIARSELRIKKRNRQLDQLIRMNDEERKILEIGVQLIDPDKGKGLDV